MPKRKRPVMEKQPIQEQEPEVASSSIESPPDASSGRDIRHSFLGTLDHFPCDLIRTLWVIQSLNVDLKQNVPSLSPSKRAFIEENLLGRSRYLTRLVELQIRRLREQRAGLLFERDVRRRYRANLQGVVEAVKVPHGNRDEERERERERGKGQRISKKRLVVKIKGSKGLKFRINLRALKEQKQSKVDPKRVEEIGEQELIPRDEHGVGVEEELFCTCRNVSYGKMIACDNERCPTEWFHYGCVGITEAPRGKWYCSLRCRKQAAGRTRIH